MSVERLRVLLTAVRSKYKGEHEEFFRRMKKELDQHSTVADLWTELNVYWDWLNYTLLENFIHRLGDPSLKEEMSHYLVSLRAFQSRTRLYDFARCCKPKYQTVKKGLKSLVTHLKMEWKDCTLEDLDNLKGHIIRKFNLPDFCFVLEGMKLGSVVVTWALPNALAKRLKTDFENTDLSEFYKEHGISSITIDGELCKYSALRHFSAFLKGVYSRKQGKNLSPFKLAAIQRKKVKRSEFNEFTKSTLRGDLDDVVYRKHHMEEVQLGHPTWWTNRTQPRLVLIEGAPGVGKTTFSEQFCYKWSQGQRLTDHKLLVLLPLRDKGVRSAKNVSDLFHHPQLQQAIAEEVEGSGGEGVALWLEAWDELEEDMRKRSSLFLKLVHGRVLPKATIIITSRPWATENIRESGSVKVDQHIEVVSTPSIQFSRVLREGRVKSDSRAKFLDYINLNPAMKAAMHTPVTANIVADIFQWSRDMESPPPTTLTQLYTALTCKLLMEHLSSLKAEGKPPKIRSLEEVPEDVKKQLVNLCRLSWEGLVRQQLTFSSSAVGGDTLGLMHGVRELYGGKDGQLSYHFMHLTLQEFLSAYHISQLPPDTQQQVIKGHVDTGHLAVAVRFFFGLTKSNPFTTSLISHHITSQRRSQSPSVFHWVYEGGDVGKLAESGETVEVRSSYAWSPLDYYVLGHSIPLFNFKWDLDFSSTSVGDEEMKTFVQSLSICKDVNCEEITKVDFSDNNISLEGIKYLVNIPTQIVQLIKVLDLGDNKLNQDAAIAFSQVLPNFTSLQELDLCDNPLGAAGAVEVLRALHHCKSPLKTLYLQRTGVGEEDIVPPTQPIVNNNLEKLYISGDLLPSIMKCPLSNTTLKTLYMSYSTLSDEAAMCLRSLLQQSVLKFRELIIRQCGVTSEGAVQLARGLTGNQWLTALDTWGNSIGDTGAAALRDMLKYNTSLQELNTGQCGITSQGAVEIAAGLTENSTLHVLQMYDNKIGVAGAEAMARMLVQNIMLQKLDLSSDKTLGEGVDVLLSSLHKNTTLHKLTLSRTYKRPSDPRVKWE